MIPNIRITYETIKSMTQQQLISVLLRFSRDVNVILSVPQNFCPISNIEDNIKQLETLSVDELRGYVAGILSPVNCDMLKITFIHRRRSATKLFSKIFRGDEILDQEIPLLCELFLAKFTNRFCFVKLTTWFDSLDIERKSIVVQSLYMNVESMTKMDEYESSSEGEEEVLEVSEDPEAMDVVTVNVVTCENCGNQWDGNAQCTCL